MIDTPSGGAPEKAPRWDLMDTESYDGGIRFLAPVLIVWGYVGIYRRKEYVVEQQGAHEVGGAPREGAPHPRDCLFCSLEQGPSLLDHVR